MLDTLRGYAVRAWTAFPKWFRWAVVVVVLVVANVTRPYHLGWKQAAWLLGLEFFVVLWTGSKHAYHYSQRTGRTVPLGRPGWVARNLELHSTQMWGEWTLYALIWMAGVPALAILGCQFVARIPFQGFINWSIGHRFVDPHEATFWTIGDRKRYKFLPGNLSLWKIPIGIALIAAAFLDLKALL
jgi:hypothetical protein